MSESGQKHLFGVAEAGVFLIGCDLFTRNVDLG